MSHSFAGTVPNPNAVVVYASRTGKPEAELARRIESIGTRSVPAYEGGDEGRFETGVRIERP